MDDKQRELTARNFPSAHDEALIASATERYAAPESAYRLAFTDTEFLLREELRPVRMQLELLKPELIQQELGIESTIVIFGSARVLPPDDAARRLDEVRAGGDAMAIRRAEVAVEMSRYYDEARRFAALVTQRSRTLDTPIYVVTGGRARITTPAGAAEVGPGSVIFGPAGEEHRFVDVVDDLTLLVMFSPANGTAVKVPYAGSRRS